MELPIKYWVPSIAPSGMAFYDGSLFPEWKNSLFISALVPGDVRRLEMLNSKVINEEILFSDLGRVRDIAIFANKEVLSWQLMDTGKLIRVMRK